MFIREQLKSGHSKFIAKSIVDYIGEDEDKLNELLDVFAEGDTRLTQRAAWPLGLLADSNPDLLKGKITFLCGLLDKPLHAAVKRNVLRTFQVLDIPEDNMGILADKCFTYLHDIKEPIAVKAFAMTVLANMCKKEPDLKNELIPMIEDLIPFGSSGIVNRSKKLLKELSKLP
ncbi:MAG: hypothetical protein K9I36_04970 [Bacteroidia bacterium]|nr:hypothetical protein [Bacteroidia bacterium]MCF8426060.1 hypothetical protein [Bacteroidia bacterium]